MARRTVVSRRLALIVGMGVVPLMSGPAASQSSGATPRFPVAQPAPLAARVALLEQRVHGFDQRLKAFERVGLKAQSGGGFTLVVNGANVVIAKDGTVTVTPAAKPGTGELPPLGSGGTPPPEDPCDPPYSVDSKGIKSIKPGCLEVGPCDPPYTVDAQGRRQPKKECL